MKQEEIHGKVILITGAGRGLGKALALGFGRLGANVACLARSENEIKKTVEEIEQENGNGIYICCDVTDLNSIQDAVKTTVEHFGGLDIVFVNAGVNNVRNEIGNDEPALWRNTIEVNLIGAYHTIRASIPYLKERGAGKIITIGSGRGHRGDANGSSYACSKAALWMLVRVAAEELRPFHICVNELIPGPVLTDMNKKFIGNKLDTIFTNGIEWVKDPEDVFPMALFMATLPIDGPTAQSFSIARREI